VEAQTEVTDTRTGAPFEEHRFPEVRHRNVEVGQLAAVALLLSVMVIGIWTPSCIRGKYLERELELARRVQNDLQPKPLPVSPSVDFAAPAQAADHVGGDFHDIFETETSFTRSPFLTLMTFGSKFYFVAVSSNALRADWAWAFNAPIAASMKAPSPVPNLFISAPK
jgi:hypothetical protein